MPCVPPGSHHLYGLLESFGHMQARLLYAKLIHSGSECAQSMKIHCAWGHRTQQLTPAGDNDALQLAPEDAGFQASEVLQDRIPES